MAAQRDWFDKDFYKVLDVSKSASEKDITRAYRKLAKKYHPDANPGDRKAEDKFKEVSAAYDVLGDTAKRKEYDEVRTMTSSGVGGNPFGGTARPRPGPAGPQDAGGGFKFEDLSDLFGGLFNRGGSGGGRAGRGPGPQRGDDVEAQLQLDFEDAVNGVTTAVNVTTEGPCATCQGSGAKPGTQPVVCPTCSGRGVLDDNQGVFSLSRPCPQCRGTGRLVQTPCETCHGSGTQRRNRQMKVRIPPGVDNGQQIRLKGRGGAGRNGGPAGDLFVKVMVGAHHLFGRRNDDLTLTVPVTYSELVLGTTLRIPTLSGAVSMRVPAGTPSGRVLRVKDRGVVRNQTKGDLLVTVEVSVPKNPSEEERAATEDLSRVTSGEVLRAHLEES